MRIFKTNWFQKWATGEGLTDESLRTAVREMAQGLIDADLGGHVVKKRVALPGRGKRGGSRTLVAFEHERCAFFIYGFRQERACEHQPKRVQGPETFGTGDVGLLGPSALQGAAAR